MALWLLACAPPQVVCEPGTVEIDGYCYAGGGDIPDSWAANELPACAGDLWDARGGPLWYGCLEATESGVQWSLGDLEGFARLELELYGEDGYVELHDAFVAGDASWALALALVDDPALHEPNATTLFGPGDAYTLEAVAFDAEDVVVDCVETVGGECRNAEPAR
ncbi:MAG: hypothetical protein ACOZNI_17675 [Myxococcota bacterium]